MTAASAGYVKHYAYYSDGSVMDSWLCICARLGNHMDSRPGSMPAEVALFELEGENALR